MGDTFFSHRREKLFFWISVGSVVLLIALFVARAVVDHQAVSPPRSESIQALQRTVSALQHKVDLLEIRVAKLEKVVESR